MATLRILALTHRMPFPPVGGGSLRTFQLVRALAEAGHQVTVLGFTYGDKPVAPDFPVRLVPVLYESPRLYLEMTGADPARSAAAFNELAQVSPEPWFANYFDCPAMDQALAAELVHGFDLAVLFCSSMARFLPRLPAALPKLLDFPDVHTAMLRRDPNTGPMEIERARRFEADAAARCVRCVGCSPLEQEAARQLLGVADAGLIPNGVDAAFFQPSPARPAADRLLFVGAMNYQPNVDAAEWFVREILPRLPNTRLEIVGASPAPRVTALASDRVRVTGFVADVRPYYHEAALVIVPLLLGGGTRLKILEAAACGKPIVSTTLGAEGLSMEQGRDIVLADGAEAFAAAVRDLLSDAPSRARLGQAARQTALRYDWSRIGRQFAELVQDAARIR